MEEIFDVGDLVTVTAVFKVGGIPTDPTSVELYVKKPDGTVSNPAPSNPSTGLYTHDISIDQAGHWQFRWEGTGAAQAAEEGMFTVRQQAVETS